MICGVGIISRIKQEHPVACTVAYFYKVFLKKGAPLLDALVPAHLNNLVAATVRTMGHGHFDKVIKEIQQVHSAHQPALSLWWRFVGSIGPKALTLLVQMIFSCDNLEASSNTSCGASHSHEYIWHWVSQDVH